MRAFDRVLVDGDVMAYAQAFVLEPKDGEPRQTLLAGIIGLKATIANLKTRFRCDDVQICMTGAGNFREQVAVTKPYKGTRKQEKPFWFYDIRKALTEQLDAITVDGEEADDWLSYIGLEDPDNTVVVTVDKDAKNSEGYFWNPRKEELVHVTKDEANYNFWNQMLVGDTVDNITGLFGVGKVKAKRVLEGCKTYKELRRAVAMAYACHKDVDDPESLINEMGKLLWMRRKKDEMWSVELDDYL